MYQIKSMSRRLFEFFNAAIMIIIAFACLAPILHVAFASISDPAKLTVNQGLILFPLGEVTFKGYEIVLNNPNILTGYLNTLFYVVVGTGTSLVLTALGAYVFSRKKFLWKNKLMLFVSITMLFNGGMIPNYMVVRYLGLYDSRWAIILPTCISVFNLIIMRTSFMALPDSLEESAKIDGSK